MDSNFITIILHHSPAESGVTWYLYTVTPYVEKRNWRKERKMESNPTRFPFYTPFINNGVATYALALKV